MDGGISPESITLIYGEPEAGKTTLAMQCAVNCAMQNYKTLFMDCDNTFSAKRLAQVSSGKFEEIAELVILVKPTDFREQTAVIDHLSEYTANNFGLVVIDTVTSLYRVNVADASEKTYALNREVIRQMAIFYSPQFLCGLECLLGALRVGYGACYPHTCRCIPRHPG